MMSSIDAILPGIDPVSGALTIPLWLAGAATAVLAAFVFLSVLRPAAGATSGMVLRVAALALAACGLWLGAELWVDHRKGQERVALNARSAELTARAVAPGSGLACLDGNAGAMVESACEKTVFASPEATAAATNYISTRLGLLADSVAYAARDPSYDAAVDRLRRSLEGDSFGLVAHVLALRDDCTADQCAALALLRDPRRVKANLKEQTFETTVARYAAEWPRTGGPVTSSLPPATSASSRGTGIPLPPGYSLPSAASIPAISIMSSEPPAPTPDAPPSATAATDAASTPEPPVRMPPRRPPAGTPQTASPPIQLAPPATGRAP